MPVLTLSPNFQRLIAEGHDIPIYRVEGATDVDIVASVLPADGALIVAAQPSFPANLVLVLTDADSSVGEMTVTIVGLDENGVVQTTVETFAGGGTETIIGSTRFSRITSITVAVSVGASGGDLIKIGTALAGAQDFSFPIPGRWSRADAAQDDWIKRGDIRQLLLAYHHIGGSTDTNGLNVQESLDGGVTVNDPAFEATVLTDVYTEQLVDLSAPYFKLNADGDATAQTRLDLSVTARR